VNGVREAVMESTAQYAASAIRYNSPRSTQEQSRDTKMLFNGVKCPLRGQEKV
jgi:hypothetical protein